MGRVVFFGEDLPASIDQQCDAAMRQAKAVLVVGSSLQVNTAASLVWEAYDRKLPIAILNLGRTEGDDLCDLRIDHGSSEVLALLMEQLQGQETS